MMVAHSPSKHFMYGGGAPSWKKHKSPRTTHRATKTKAMAMPWSDALPFGGRKSSAEPVFVVVAPTMFDETTQAVRALQEGANVVLQLSNLPSCDLFS